MRRLRIATACALSPMILAGFMLASFSSFYFSPMMFYMLPLVYGLAHILFWLAFVVAKALRSRFGGSGHRACAIRFSVAMFMLSCLGYVATYFSMGGGFELPMMLRDAVGLAFAGALAYIVFLLIMPRPFEVK